MGCVCVSTKQLTQHQNELQQTQCELNSLKGEYKESQQELRQTQNEQQQTQNELKEINIEFKQTQKQLEAINSDLKETENELDVLRDEYKQLQQNNNHLDKKNSSLNLKLQSIQKEKDKYEYSWYYLEHGKAIELQTALVHKLECLKIGESFTDKHKMSSSKFIKLETDICAEKKTFGLSRISIVRRKKLCAKQIYGQVVCQSDIHLTDNTYPPWWQKVDVAGYSDVNLIEMDMKTNCVAMEVANRFNQTSKHLIIKIESMQNKLLYDKWLHERHTLIKLIGENNINERNLFHGTKTENVMRCIETEGFRKEFNTSAAIGNGTYFARDSSYSVGYSSHNNGVRKMFECKVLCGESVKGNGNYKLVSWPKKPSGLMYDSLVNTIQDPSMFVLHENNRAYPMFVITFRCT